MMKTATIGDSYATGVPYGGEIVAMQKERKRIVRMGKVTVRQSGCGAGLAAALLSTWVDRCQGVCRSPRAAWSVEDRYQEG